MSDDSILPKIMGELLHVDRAIASRIGAIDQNSIQTISDPATCPADFLPWLAYHYSVDSAWSLAESLDAKRALIIKAKEIHKKKGTPWAIKEIVRLLGFGECEIIECISKAKYNDTIKYDGMYVHGDLNSWATYRIFIKSYLTIDQAESLRKAIVNYAPARCTLASIEYDAIPIRYNGQAKYDGTYTYGSS